MIFTILPTGKLAQLVQSIPTLSVGRVGSKRSR
ncbi:hypothetical protein HDC90_003077 [Pedobacter sp. AK013]|nr:hypothetical protein [Pedobacter sp. AK013]